MLAVLGETNRKPTNLSSGRLISKHPFWVWLLSFRLGASRDKTKNLCPVSQKWASVSLLQETNPFLDPGF